MVYDRYEVEYHLTPGEWLTGTVKDFGDKEKENVVEPPSDRVETWLYKMEQSSEWSPEDIGWYLIWIHPSLAPADRVALRHPFLPPGRKFPAN